MEQDYRRIWRQAPTGLKCEVSRRFLAAGEQHKDIELQVEREESNGMGVRENIAAEDNLKW